MAWRTLTKSVGMGVGAGLLLLACGPETTAQDTAPADSKTDDRVHAMAPPDSCDPWEDHGWCLVSGSRVTCNNGIQMYAYHTPDGWCINADVCKNAGGPIICPEW
ncbi:hypothetical protein [Corallococcus sp. Z5C101001]|uniref:hypothetical protein n=1 Tax=Corallococcus sp. Z5C101001 TaxID=2596829 RepID=UPI001180384C|nr:hypothetical protein [Corallococcus sp. Z5C101001]TSC31583.1 hypothetical protein FOF48_13040 [Corallococcus sp. Z5C101001]